ncbi:hypothetical protein AWJ20_916 [Sugiyamaella lignohabitans]|uniref:Biogenesis of lysosome-related organelles complex 1 subunit CNL1 n=1 Tax=Sugiyamaella lignohabitans TaxID=796027 RepID=A0A167D9R4_9ASCO|nr:uncharacterized protein AWJ20_916 [Sugiyamaella lignohabitans]ANB12654.1 hypothetical protein AWJ20_916 [Sugiyamaella lignohabitans]
MAGVRESARAGDGGGWSSSPEIVSLDEAVRLQRAGEEQLRRSGSDGPVDYGESSSSRGRDGEAGPSGGSLGSLGVLSDAYNGQNQGNVPEEEGDDEHEEHEEHEEDIFGISKFAGDFAELVSAVGNRINEMSETARKSVASNHQHLVRNEIAIADDQMAQLKSVLTECDDLELELMKIRQIGEIAKSFKIRMLAIEEQLARPR